MPTSKAISKTVLNRLAEARRKRYPPEPSEQHRLHSVITAAGLTPPRDGQLAEAIIWNTGSAVVASGSHSTNIWQVSPLCSAEGTPSAREAGLTGSLGATHTAADCTSSSRGWNTEGFCIGLFVLLPLNWPQEYPYREVRLNGKVILALTLPEEADLCVPPPLHSLLSLAWHVILLPLLLWFLESIRCHS